MGNGLSLSNFSGYSDESSGAISEPDRKHIMSFEDVQSIINVNVNADANANFNSAPAAVGAQRKGLFLLISTLSANHQACIIKHTVTACDEEARINDIISGRDDDGENITVVVYGKNSSDESVAAKCNQLKTLGISNVYAYLGGMFEWLLLQDIYGTELFPTTGKCADILEYRPTATLRRGNSGRNLIQ